ncbi:MAG TPA: DNA-3-methyladenine glycosylase, partial [Ktedonobacterales bacterium]
QRSTGEGLLTLRLAYRPPFDAHTLLGYLEHRALPGVEDVRGGVYRRTIRLPHSRGVIELEPLAGAHAVALRMRLDSLRDLAPLVAHCRALFDLDAAPAAIGDVLANDRLLGPLVAARPGLRVPGAVDGFELAVRAILGQQVSVAGARTMAGRLVAAAGEPLGRPESALSHFFPTPQALATASMDGLGLTQGRINALRGLARAVADDGLNLSRGADWTETVRDLLRIPGIGPWTASYIAMRALGDPDAFPAADLALRHAFERHGLPGDPHTVERHAQAWRPWRAYAAHHLWAGLPSSPQAQPTHQRERAPGAAIVTLSK